MRESQERIRRVSFRDLLTIFFYKSHVFLGILITIMGITMGVALLADPVYKVSGNILVKPLLEQSVKLMAPPATQLTATPVRVQEITSEVSILESPQLLGMVVKELDLTKEEKPKTLFAQVWLNLMTRLQKLMVDWGLSVEPPRAPSCMLSLPRMTVPAARSRRTTSASAAAARSPRGPIPLVVGMPATSMLSFSAIGIPSSGPRASPRARRASAAAASARASSARTAT